MRLHSFGSGDPLAEFEELPQAQYLRCYLSDLKAKSVVEEPHYFDRDYLDEFAAYYSRVATQTSNLCRRLHFFDTAVTDESLSLALEGPGQERERLQAAYLGFTVVRPLSHAPLGRSVVKWYPDDLPRYQGNPRITTSRAYSVHLAGLRLEVVGLAWQQQDGAIALCATTGLWSMLHASAFDDHHAIPSTAEVTRLAYQSLRQGAHVFPASDGLDVRQMVEAIARARLTPLLMEGDLANSGFTRDKFAACSVMLRSGFPVLISGRLTSGEGHVICATGFREVGPGGAPGAVVLQDSNIATIYAHDDNLGPNVRLMVRESKSDGRITLRPKPPPKRYQGRRLKDPVKNYPDFFPQHLIVGVHEGLHVTADELNRIAMIITANLRPHLSNVQEPLTSTARFVRIAAYLEAVITTPFGGPLARAKRLAKIRSRISSELPPMSLHVGVVRVGYGSAPVADVLIDTSDRPHIDTANSRVARWTAFGTVLFAAGFEATFNELSRVIPLGKVLNVGVN